MRRGAAPGLLLTVLLAAPAPLAAQESTLTQARMQIYAGPLYRDYLGCLTCGQYEVSSVWNGYGPYGWDNVYPDHSHFARYRAPQGRYSACDRFAAEPPILIDTSGKNYGRLNVSTTRSDSICGPHGAQGICQTLTAMCKRTAETSP
ncbi:hypothetical protein [Magnetospirillum molischianum]|uniref:Secreted protein n=1 Tax=Magnetospirillum molischianum DSM 120 TaxID=1150626 RepID=H8FWE2_MAGML|nr:hypothetical protein [Magnetospirillum molischianum]CCG42680.1 exported hypothetical protein [Magnetospirillum molischianum DSM 120]